MMIQQEMLFDIELKNLQLYTAYNIRQLCIRPYILLFIMSDTYIHMVYTLTIITAGGGRWNLGWGSKKILLWGFQVDKFVALPGGMSFLKAARWGQLFFVVLEISPASFALCYECSLILHIKCRIAFLENPFRIKSKLKILF